MGNSTSKGDGGDATSKPIGRTLGITGGNAAKRTPAPKIAANNAKSSPEDYPLVEVRSGCIGTEWAADTDPLFLAGILGKAAFVHQAGG
jgi:hypothetical protein